MTPTHHEKRNSERNQQHSADAEGAMSASMSENGAKSPVSEPGRQSERPDETPSTARKSNTDTKVKAPAKKVRLIRLIRRDTSANGQVRMTKHGYALIEAGATNGVSKAGIAKRLGVSTGTFADILKRDPKAQESFDLGTGANEDELRDLLMDKARDGNVTAMIYLTKARHGWVEGDAPDTRPNVIINLPDALPIEEYMRRVQIKEPT